MPPPDRPSLWQLIAGAGLPEPRFIADSEQRIHWLDVARATTLNAPLDSFLGKCVLLRTAHQLPTILAAVELDGIASRLILCPPDFPAAHLPAIIADAAVDFLVHDETIPTTDNSTTTARCGLPLTPITHRPAPTQNTEWILFTSGTTGRPKMVIHTLPGLTGPLDDGLAVTKDAVWSTFYDIRRYGGLQILLRACLGGGSMVLSDTRESLAAFLARAGAAGVTHISGTPSHWRRALMSNANAMSPAYVRLSGEVADQAILNNLKQAYPHAAVAHAFASTEAGVAFDVRDGMAGFPAAYIDDPNAKIAMRVQDGSLRIRSSRTALRYIGEHTAPVMDSEGYVDTGDLVERRDGRYYFVGRREGIINVGGQKVHPEEVEAVVNLHPAVLMSRVRGRPSPITGAIVAADIVLNQASVASNVQHEILETCRTHLPAFKVPALLTIVEKLDVGAAGKLLRRA
jgi:acyl-coenzyme A synthetase/AMP-(fatty) acid ligase